MPAKPRRGERLLEDALRALCNGLDETGAPWMIIGGIAGIARGIARFTTDIDAAVRGDAVTVRGLVEHLGRHRISPRIDDAITFAEENLVLLLRHEPTGVDLDVSFAWSGFEHEALDARTVVSFGRVRAPMVTPDDLLVFKAIAGRPKDAQDAEALLALYPALDLARARRRVRELAALAEAPELATQFETWLRRRPARPHRRPAAAKPRARRKP